MTSSPNDSEPYRLLFVCTGNTCRSPLAEVLARRAVASRGWSHVEVSSAGVATGGGGPASEGSVRAAARRGLDLADHRSTPLTAELLAGADVILAMGPGHLAIIQELGAGERADLLTTFATGEEGGEGVLDPYGGPDELYEETCALLEELVEGALDRLEPVVAP